jgi:hypothetical protein
LKAEPMVEESAEAQLEVLDQPAGPEVASQERWKSGLT